MKTDLGVAALCVALVLCGSPAMARTILMRGVVVGDAERPSAVSGSIVSVYATVILASNDGQIRTIFVQYLSGDQYLPRDKDRCEIRYRNEKIAGHISSTPIYLDRAPRAEWIHCNSGSWSEAKANRRIAR